MNGNVHIESLVEKLALARATVSELKTQLEERDTENELPEGTYKMSEAHRLRVHEAYAVAMGQIAAANTLQALSRQAYSFYEQKLTEATEEAGLPKDTKFTNVDLTTGLMTIELPTDDQLDLSELLENDALGG